MKKSISKSFRRSPKRIPNQKNSVDKRDKLSNASLDPDSPPRGSLLDLAYVNIAKTSNGEPSEVDPMKSLTPLKDIKDIDISTIQHTHNNNNNNNVNNNNNSNNTVDHNIDAGFSKSKSSDHASDAEDKQSQHSSSRVQPSYSSDSSNDQLMAFSVHDSSSSDNHYNIYNNNNTNNNNNNNKDKLTKSIPRLEASILNRKKRDDFMATSKTKRKSLNSNTNSYSTDDSDRHFPNVPFADFDNNSDTIIIHKPPPIPSPDRTYSTTASNTTKRTKNIIASNDSNTRTHTHTNEAHQNDSDSSFPMMPTSEIFKLNPNDHDADADSLLSFMPSSIDSNTLQQANLVSYENFESMDPFQRHELYQSLLHSALQMRQFQKDQEDGIQQQQQQQQRHETQDIVVLSNTVEELLKRVQSMKHKMVKAKRLPPPPKVVLFQVEKEQEIDTTDIPNSSNHTDDNTQEEHTISKDQDATDQKHHYSATENASQKGSLIPNLANISIHVEEISAELDAVEQSFTSTHNLELEAKDTIIAALKEHIQATTTNQDTIPPSTLTSGSDNSDNTQSSHRENNTAPPPQSQCTSTITEYETTISTLTLDLTNIRLQHEALLTSSREKSLLQSERINQQQLQLQEKDECIKDLNATNLKLECELKEERQCNNVNEEQLQSKNQEIVQMKEEMDELRNKLKEKDSISQNFIQMDLVQQLQSKDEDIVQLKQQIEALEHYKSNVEKSGESPLTNSIHTNPSSDTSKRDISVAIQTVQSNISDVNENQSTSLDGDKSNDNNMTLSSHSTSCIPTDQTQILTNLSKLRLNRSMSDSSLQRLSSQEIEVKSPEEGRSKSLSNSPFKSTLKNIEESELQGIKSDLDHSNTSMMDSWFKIKRGMEIELERDFGWTVETTEEKLKKSRLENSELLKKKKELERKVIELEKDIATFGKQDDFQKLKIDELEKSIEDHIEIEASYKNKILSLQKECSDYAEQMTSLEDKFKDLNESLRETLPISPSSHSDDTPASPEQPSDNVTDHDTLNLEAAKNANEAEENVDILSLRKDNELLKRRIKSLEVEVDNVSGLLHETISASKWAETEMSKNQLEHKDETRRSKFFGRRKADQKSDNHPKMNTSDSTDNNSVNHQLEKLCKVHQFTVMKQRKELVFLRTAIETKEDEILKLRNEIKSNEAQITVLENHFMELNSDSTVQLSLVRKSSEDSIERPSSIIKVDAAYVSELESERKSNANMITDFRNQINELKTRNDELMKSQEKANELNDHIEKLKAQVKARELSINALEKAYEQQQMNTSPDNCPTLRVTPRRFHPHRRIFSIDSAVSDEGLNHAMSSIASTEGDVHNLSLDDTNDSLTPDQLRCKLVASESRIHKLEAKIASFERIKNETGSSEKAIVARLRKVNLLQEMVEAASRRLNNILNKLEESKQEQPETESEEKIDMGDVLSLGTKLNVIQDNVMVSLRLLEIRLSNELESMRSGVATNNGNGCEQQNSNSSKQNTENESRVMDESESAALVEVRFNRTMESLNEIEKQMNENVEKLKMEIRHYDLKLGVKDDIIEGLIQSEKELKETIETLREEVEVFKSLESFSSVNVGVMARFKECRRLENEVKEKDRVIQRLNVVIEEYRTV